MAKKYKHGSASATVTPLSAKLLRAAASAAPQTSRAIRATIDQRLAAIRPSVASEIPKTWRRPVKVRGKVIEWVTESTPTRQAATEWPVRTGRSWAAFRTRMEIKPPNTINGVITNPIRYAWIVKGRNVSGKGRAINKLIKAPLKKDALKLADLLVDELTNTVIKGGNSG